MSVRLVSVDVIKSACGIADYAQLRYEVEVENPTGCMFMEISRTEDSTEDVRQNKLVQTSWKMDAIEKDTESSRVG